MLVANIKGMDETTKDENKHELAVERFKYVLDWYQEKPHFSGKFNSIFLKPSFNIYE